MTKNVIIFGDSRDRLDKVTTPINCIITDPPYGVDFKSKNTRLPGSKQYSERLKNDGDLEGAIKLFTSVMDKAIPKLADEAEVYVFTGWQVLDVWMPICRDLAPELKLKMMLLWDKGYPGLGDLEGNWGCGHEVILYLKKGRRSMPYRRSGIIHVDKLAAGKNVHPTEKPVQLIETLIEMSTSPGDFVLDPFSGSGSTSVAAQKLGRHSLAFDIVEKYVKIGQDRLKNQSLF